MCKFPFSHGILVLEVSKTPTTMMKSQKGPIVTALLSHQSKSPDCADPKPECIVVVQGCFGGRRCGFEKHKLETRPAQFTLKLYLVLEEMNDTHCSGMHGYRMTFLTYGMSLLGNPVSLNSMERVR